MQNIFPWTRPRIWWIISVSADIQRLLGCILFRLSLSGGNNILGTRRFSYIFPPCAFYWMHTFRAVLCKSFLFSLHFFICNRGCRKALIYAPWVVCCLYFFRYLRDCRLLVCASLSTSNILLLHAAVTLRFRSYAHWKISKLSSFSPQFKAPKRREVGKRSGGYLRLGLAICTFLSHFLDHKGEAILWQLSTLHSLSIVGNHLPLKLPRFLWK